MAAYVIGRLQVRDASWREQYRAKVSTIVEKHGGRYLVRGGAMETLEGNASLPTGIVVVEFLSVEKARAFYNDPEYAPLIKLRQGGSDLDLVVVEGV
ncbi:MAG: DUF1330 domain-containing protein [Candidatus Binatia bacterium]